MGHASEDGEVGDRRMGGKGSGEGWAWLSWLGISTCIEDLYL